MGVKTHKVPQLLDNEYTVKVVHELNFFDLTGNRAKTKGSSSKFYHIELQVSKADDLAQLFSMYGPTGYIQKKEWRYFDSESAAKKELEKILKSKRKKGYKDVDIAQHAFGSEAAKAIVKPVQLKNIELIEPAENKSTLHIETQRIISELMGATNNFVVTLLKCPLGQLTNQQIEKGQQCLNDAKTILKSKKGGKSKLEQLTNDFYSLIPHNLGRGSRGKLEDLLLDSEQKILQKEADLDTLLDAKSLNISFQNSDIDQKYKSLNAEFIFVEHDSEIFKWIDSMVQETKAYNHRNLGNINVLNVWAVKRNKEYDQFIENTKFIADECGTTVFPDGMRNLVIKRPDMRTKDGSIYKRANVLPLFHGTRTENIVGITKNGLLIRPSNAVYTGSMYGSGCIYFSNLSTKSINYCSIKSSIWARGKDNKAFLFLNDCALGKQKIASGPYPYTLNNISPAHSVWAVGGRSGVINNEFMLYRTDQHNIRYLIEFTCQN